MAEKIKFAELEASIEKMTKKCIQNVLQDKQYEEKEAQGWIQKITEDSIAELVEMNDGQFKYIVQCYLVQMRNGGIHGTSAVHWDKEADGTVNVRWENDTMNAFMTVYAVNI